MSRALVPVMPPSGCLDSDLSGPCSVCLRDSDGQHAIGVVRLHLVALHGGRQGKGTLEWAVQALDTGMLTRRFRVRILALTGDHHCRPFELDSEVMRRHPW